MIDLGKYAITSSDNCYSLGEKRIRQSDAKDGKSWFKGDEYVMPLESYHATAEGCVEALIRKLQRERIAENDVLTLREAASEFRRINEEVREWANIEGAKEGRDDG